MLATCLLLVLGLMIAQVFWALFERRTAVIKGYLERALL
jgi:hypothetical protein